MPYRKHLVTLFKIIEGTAALNPELRQYVAKHVKLRKIDKGDLLLRVGAPCNELYFCSEGLFRSYYFGENGDEITSAFSLEKEFFTNVKGFVNFTDSDENIEALETSHVCLIERSDYINLLQKFPQLLLISHHSINFHRVELIERLRIFQKTRAKDKLAYFESYYPTLKDRVLKKHIASFLGIRYETLSRIS